MNPSSEATFGAGDTHLHFNLLPNDVCADIFARVKREVEWSVMHHRGGEVPRLVAVQGDVAEDGSCPVYRHPSDESPPLLAFSPTVQLIREHVERVVQHPVNHALIQLYRGGTDYISEHSDKTVDIAPNTYIVNVSLGAERIMTLRTKKDAMASGAERQKQRIPLPHNSLLAFGLKTNRQWLHAVNADKRMLSMKVPAELAEGGERISLTFRNIHTFLSADQTLTWGAGACGKERGDARPVVRGGPEGEALLAAFGEENHSSNFDWDKAYGQGFDVLHLH
ncbi:hypothetical protein PENSPDRAFT_584601 [Peniophora sp. CONT]|nr:hypothetical protein PENSPDRAFT_584601 [Peniophora sp. CONT]